MKHTIITALAIILAASGSPSAFGQSSQEAAPALGVARISLINGDVTAKRGESGDWVAAEVNQPAVEGDIVSTGPGARAEVQLDYSNLIRLDGSTELELAALQTRRFRVRLFQGRITYSELRGGEADIDIETPHAAIRPHKNGRYEIETGPDQTVVQVRRGQVEVYTPGGTETIDRNRMLVVRRDGEIRTTRAEPSGDWDRWNEQRDERLAKSESYRYVSRSISGAPDLDQHGDWRYAAGHGWTWFPVGMGPAWAPYRHGRWAWMDYYGWNWIGYEPWGWAPYHYGRWFHHAAWGWGWHPGPAFHHHFWRPALVSFVGFGPGFGMGFGFGRVGWVPLAPGDPFFPWWGGGGFIGRGGIRNTTIVNNNINVFNVHRNARAPNGVTVVDAQGFSKGLANNPLNVRRDELQRASAIRGQIPVVPDRASQGRVVRAAADSSRGGGAANVRQQTFSRAGGVRATRPAVQRTGFDAQREQVASSVRDFNTRQTGAAGVRGRAAGAAAEGRTGTAAGSPARGGVRSGRAQGSESSPGGSVRTGTRDGWQDASRAGRVAGSRVERSAGAPAARFREDAIGRSTVRAPQGELGGRPRGGIGVRGAEAGAPSRSAPGGSASPRIERSRGGLDRGSIGRGAPGIDRSRTMSAPPAARSRVDVGAGSRVNPGMGSPGGTVRSMPRSAPSSRPSIASPRSAPSGGFGGARGGFGRGGGIGAAPRSSGPAMSGPRSAPSSGGGRMGGGGSAPSGSAGGGVRSGGGRSGGGRGR